MLKKLWLCRNIRKFYKIFGKTLDVVPCRIRIKDLRQDGFLDGVRFDIAEIIESRQYLFYDFACPMDKWLDKLYKECLL